MNKYMKKLYLLIILIFINIISLTGCMNKAVSRSIENKKSNNIIEDHSEITEKNAKAISIGNYEIENISNVNNKTETSTRIENISDFDVSNIKIQYNEYDKSNNVISYSESSLDLTLLPRESAYIIFGHKEYTDRIKIISYKYQSQGKEVIINAGDNNIEILNTKEEDYNVKDYEVLTISDAYKLNESRGAKSFGIKIKNSSAQDLGNIILKVGELNEDKEYININHVSSDKVLKTSEEVELEFMALKNTEYIKVLGYSYDNMKEKGNVYVDIKSHKVRINK